MKHERSDLLERFEPMFEAPTPSFEAFLRRRERKRRNQRAAAIVVAIAVFVVPAWIVAADTWSDDAPTPAVPRPPAPTGAGAIDQAFVDSINDCGRLLVTPAQVESLLGFRADPAPFEPGGTPEGLGVRDPLSTGCEYDSLGWIPGLGEVVTGHEGPGGHLVIAAYLADAPPPPMGRSDPVPALGDAARFSPYGNGDEHLNAYEGATSVLEVRRGDLILRLNGGSFVVAGNVVVQHLTGYPLEALEALAESALHVLDQMVVVGEPSVPPYSPSPRARWTRTVEGVSFSFRADRSWTAGPITRSADELKVGHLLISKSILGPQGAEAVIFWTSMSDGPAAPCGQWWGSPVGSMADFAAAVATADGTELVSGPSPSTVGGLPAQHVIVSVRDDVGCDPGFFYRWNAECRGPCWIESTVGDTIRVWVVDVDGTRLFFAAETTTQADAALEREIERIVASIRFG